MKQYVEEEKPYWLFLDAQRGQEMRYGLFNYFPAAHYERAIDQALDDAESEHLVPDGGRYTETMYAWYDPDTDTYLTHAEAGDEFATPFFEEEDQARRYLDHRSHEVDDTAQFEGLTLRKLRAKKIGEAVEVLTDQAGIEDFMPDGGRRSQPRHEYTQYVQSLADADQLDQMQTYEEWLEHQLIEERRDVP